MKHLLGLDPKRKKDQEFFQKLIDTHEITRTSWGNGELSDTQFETDSILAYQQRVREKIVRELEKFTEAIEALTQEFKDFKLELSEIKEFMVSVKESLTELVEDRKKGESWQSD